MNIFGYRRSDGQFGIRNHLLILPTSVCSTTVAFNIAAQVPGAVAIPNQHGCCQVGADYTQTLRTLIGLGKNPNVGAVLVVGLGCEGIPIQETAAEIAKSGKPVQVIIIQEHGGTLKTTALGVQIASQMARSITLLKPVEAPLSELSLGIECGGSDFTSGLASNPAVGTASDLLVKAGGTAMLSETTEFIGAEHVLAKRAISPEVAQKLMEIVQQTELRAKQLHVDLRQGQPTPGNITGGISSIEEKSLGCIYKAGHSPIQDILPYGQPPCGKGLYVMDTPGQDVESISGMLAGGVQVVVFTTGRGTPTGSPIAPVIKVTANSDTYQNMEDNIDLDLSSIISGEETIEQAGRRIFAEMVEVANGKFTKSESLGHREFGIFRIGSTF
ncbi:altronate dehydratase [Desulfitobacterium dichloroeliminans LMG P-21439]|uniref:Altronate dehydratase n=1 Tax=Desulfitobacterium dichloroeliminans (strain LMG P-21439 / DCA1) TaxID=871963 RepID=L0F9K5_DESDL|nr:UxaA family hydrolase [Desulfitobacterium dichloroeliminans]AGA69705.1 altronate dehydratase [Desulfitobacterium dichloroeliminans LMG P-21439]